MPHGTDRITSLLVRELVIISRDFGRLSGGCWELSRVLLRNLSNYDTLSVNKGESGAESDGANPPSDAVSEDPFGPQLEIDYD